MGTGSSRRASLAAAAAAVVWPRVAGARPARKRVGANPDDPVQAPTSFLLVLNLRTPAEQGIVVRQYLLATADRVIE